MQREADEEGGPSARSCLTSSGACCSVTSSSTSARDMLEERDRKLLTRERELDKAKEELAKARQEQIAALERVSHLSQDDAKQLLLEQVRGDAEHDAVRLARAIERKAREDAEDKARDVVVTAIQRVMVDHTAEMTVSAVQLPSEEMKGRIIGREGRNIRALEQATGVDLIIDDTPETVLISGFDPVRREIARLALDQADPGRPHPPGPHRGSRRQGARRGRAGHPPGRRGGGVRDGRAGLAAGDDQAAGPAQVPHQLRPERAQALDRDRPPGRRHRRRTGRRRARPPRPAACCTTSARRSTTRSKVRTPRSAPRSRQRHNLPMKVINAIAAHHQEVEYECIEAPIVQIADAISASRPGARGESSETYLKRLEELQAIADSFEGVEKSFAVQAGREVRILVRPEEIDDLASTRLARDIVRKIEESLTYPGQIKVTVIRETRAVEYAK